MSKWCLGKTAPKDGTAILGVFRDVDGCLAIFHCCWEQYEWDDSRYEAACDYEENGAWKSINPHLERREWGDIAWAGPLYWMPAPKTPEQNSGQDDEAAADAPKAETK